MIQRMREQKVQMAKERMAESNSAQLQYIQKEEEIQTFLQMERREAAMREQLRREEEARQRFQPLREQRTDLQNLIKEDVENKAANFQEEFSKFQRMNGR